MPSPTRKPASARRAGSDEKPTTAAVGDTTPVEEDEVPADSQKAGAEASADDDAAATTPADPTSTTNADDTPAADATSSGRDTADLPSPCDDCFPAGWPADDSVTDVGCTHGQWTR